MNEINRKKATIHVSIDPNLSDRIRRVCDHMALPVSHFASLALSREVARFESEFSVKPSQSADVTRSARP